MSDNPLIKEVAAPGSVFWEKVTHPENLELLEGDPQKTRKLPKDRLTRAISRFQQLQAAINRYFGAYTEYLEQCRAEIMESSLWVTESFEAEAAVEAINIRIGSLQQHMREVAEPRRMTVTITSMKQAKEVLTTIYRLSSRIEEHYRAIENEEISKRLRDEMMQEISFYARQLVDRWTALGYREERTYKGRTTLKRVKIEECHYTEDSIQFKIWVTSMNVLKSTHHHLPNGVKGWDLVKPETLRELEMACECPVTSPHMPDEEAQGFEHGAWIEVHRVGMRGGLFEYIELDTVLAKYNQALRPRFAVPVGIKAGRQIEYLYLDQTPHLMFNGVPGSGKTNIARVFLAVWCRFFSPDEIRFVCVDLKRSGDLNVFADIPHLLTPIIKDLEGLEKIAPLLVNEMYRRMDLLSQSSSFDIRAYNAKAAPDDRMPRIVVFIDECQAIRDLSQKDQQQKVWRALTLIATQARAAGIHLMLGTQQPSVQVIPASVTNQVTWMLSGRQRTTSGAMMTSGNNRLKEIPAIQGRMHLDNGFGGVMLQTPYGVPSQLEACVMIARTYPPRSNPLLLDGDEDTSEFITLEIEGVTPDRIVMLALEHHAGALNSQKIYELTRKVTPERTIRTMIQNMAREKSVEYGGVTYAVVPKGKGYCLKRTGETSATEVSSTIVSSAV